MNPIKVLLWPVAQPAVLYRVLNCRPATGRDPAAMPSLASYACSIRTRLSATCINLVLLTCKISAQPNYRTLCSNSGLTIRSRIAVYSHGPLDWR